MREFNYRLGSMNLTGENGEVIRGAYKGEVVLKVPNFIDRTRIMREIDLGKIDEETGEFKKLDSYEMLIKLEELTRNNLLQLKITKGKTTFQSYDELSYDSDFSSFIMEVGMIIARSVDLGKK